MRDPKVRLRGLSEIATNPPRLIFGEQLGCRSPPRLVLEIDVGELLAVVIAHDEARRLFRSTAAWIGAVKTFPPPITTHQPQPELCQQGARSADRRK